MCVECTCPTSGESHHTSSQVLLTPLSNPFSVSENHCLCWKSAEVNEQPPLYDAQGQTRPRGRYHLGEQRWPMMQRSTTKSPSRDSVLNRVVTFTPFVLSHGVHGCPSFAASLLHHTWYPDASSTQTTCRQKNTMTSLKHATDRQPSTSLHTELLKLLSSVVLSSFCTPSSE